MPALVSLTIPVDVPLADERANQQQKGQMNVRAPLVADSQSTKSMKPLGFVRRPNASGQAVRVTRPRSRYFKD